uniref:Uncharacterized protein n=1 Tax=Athene cunicularia TaxID=194338 RepID=A0A663N026_ATHCN
GFPSGTIWRPQSRRPIPGLAPSLLLADPLSECSVPPDTPGPHKAEMLPGETGRWMECGKMELRPWYTGQMDTEREMEGEEVVSKQRTCKASSRQQDAQQHPAFCSRVHQELSTAMLFAQHS